ncbi:MAG: OB-fold nucleic acid binding domain-containing protein [Candidatus Woesearchaeota archaeon]|jgi:exonuclease VII large subunit|nr:OB-fold nucleic acid binding domain-containing protein [Candidatus Woesearchaeota archaeon]
MKLSERTIIKISFIIFLLSFTLLYYLDSTLEVKQIPINEISIKNLNEYVAIKASISKQTVNKNNSFLILKDSSGEIDAIIFNIKNKIPNEEYLFLGKVSLYDDKLELIIDEIKTQNHESNN